MDFAMHIQPIQRYLQILLYTLAPKMHHVRAHESLRAGNRISPQCVKPLFRGSWASTNDRTHDIASPEKVKNLEAC